MIHLLIPMSGQGTRFQKAGYLSPKPLIKVNGTPMIERLLMVFPDSWPSHFVYADNHEASGLRELLLHLRPEATIRSIPQHSEGPIKAIEAALENIPDKDPVFVSYCDYSMVWDAKAFESFVKESNCDAALVSYKGFHPHYLNEGTYAYSRLEHDRVVEVKEKGSFTDNRENEYASSGGYYFRTARILKQALIFQREHDLRMNGEFYTSLTVEALLRMSPEADVRIFEIPKFFQWGTPKDLEHFEYWERTYRAAEKFSDASDYICEQIQITMAGKGSRLQDKFNLPKPFIPINNRPMFRRALDSLPRSEKEVLLVGLEDHQKYYSEMKETHERFIGLRNSPQGQALSTLEGLTHLNPKKSVLISSCDHAIVLNPSLWRRFLSIAEADAAIFTVKGFPGVSIHPEKFAYVDVLESRSDFLPVKNVSVKKVLSSQPLKDLLLVGTFWFKDVPFLIEAINLLRDSGKTVNGEYYLDSVFDLYLEQGKKVCTIPLEGYINWGDPVSFSMASYWHGVFCGSE